MESRGENFGFNQTQDQMLAQRQSAVDFKTDVYEMPALMDVFPGVKHTLSLFVQHSRASKTKLNMLRSTTVRPMKTTVD